MAYQIKNVLPWRRDPMSLENLIATAPPPSSPREVPSAAVWTDVQKDTGIEFPIAYQEIVNIYGTGMFDDFLWVYNPASAVPAMNLPNVIRVDATGYGSVAGEPFLEGISIYPDKNCIVPWGVSESAMNLYWKTCPSETEGYVIIVLDTDFLVWHEYDVSFSDFIVSMLDCSIEVPGYAEEYFVREHFFRPIKL